jgi:type IV secretory pathway TrbD component
LPPLGLAPGRPGASVIHTQRRVIVDAGALTEPILLAGAPRSWAFVSGSPVS